MLSNHKMLALYNSPLSNVAMLALLQFPILFLAFAKYSKSAAVLLDIDLDDEHPCKAHNLKVNFVTSL